MIETRHRLHTDIKHKVSRLLNFRFPLPIAVPLPLGYRRMIVPIVDAFHIFVVIQRYTGTTIFLPQCIAHIGNGGHG